MAGTRSRGWSYTVNGYSDEDIERIRALDVEYGVFGREVAPTTGALHLQCYAYFKNARTFAQVKALLPEGAHIEKANGNAEQNRAYCMKEGHAEEKGACPAQGKRSDVDKIRELVRAGATIQQIADVAPSYQALKFGQTLLSIAPNTSLRLGLRVEWLWGPTGAGKTRAAYEEASAIGEVWISSRNLKWWDGYTGQPCVIFDDLRGDFCTFHEMLRILDIYPLRVEVKGGSVAAAYTHVWITSAFPPTNLWQSVEDKGQLMRRIHAVRELPAPGGAEAPTGVPDTEVPDTEVGGNTIPRLLAAGDTVEVTEYP